MSWLRTDVMTRGQARLLPWAAVIGALAGGAAVLFRIAALNLPFLVWPPDADLIHSVARAPIWSRLIIPVAGSLLAGLVLMLGTRWAGPGQGWDILEAVVLRDGILHVRPALVRSVSSLLTIGSAGAIGREGPMVLLAATISSVAGRLFRVPTRHLRVLVGCGAAAGIACAYNTPIAAALFTMEIIVGNFALEVFAPLVFASVVATLISRLEFGNQPLFGLVSFSMVSGWEIVPYTLLGILGGLASGLFLAALRTSSSLFRRSRLPRPIAMAAVGLALGVTILWFPDVVGNGREAIRHLFTQNWSFSLGITLFCLRLMLTSATVGSGAVGGVFTPTLFLGAVLGDTFGTFVHRLLPGLTAGPKAYAVVGMGALLAGTIHAPLTAVVMIFEMTLDYNIVLPLLVASAAASLVAREVSRESVYTEALKRKRGTGTREEAVMRTLTVRDVMRSDQVTIPSDMPLPQILDRFISARRNHLYVVGPDGRFGGVIGLHDVNQVLREREDPSALTAREVANARFKTTTPEETLDKILEIFWAEETERLPVLESAGAGRLLGTVSQRDIMGIYSLEVLNSRSMVARFETAGSDNAPPKYVELPVDHRVEEIDAPACVIGRTVAEARFREIYGLSVLIIHRTGSDGRENRILPEGSSRFEKGDRLTVFGQKEKVAALRELSRVGEPF